MREVNLDDVVRLRSIHLGVYNPSAQLPVNTSIARKSFHVGRNIAYYRIKGISYTDYPAGGSNGRWFAEGTPEKELYTISFSFRSQPPSKVELPEQTPNLYFVDLLAEKGIQQIYTFCNDEALPYHRLNNLLVAWLYVPNFSEQLLKKDALPACTDAVAVIEISPGRYVTLSMHSKSPWMETLDDHTVPTRLRGYYIMSVLEDWLPD